MLEIYERLGTLPSKEAATEIEATLYTHVILSHEQRERGRLKLKGTNGEEIHVFLDRGKPLLIGEYLKSECGKYIKIEGVPEQVSHATCDDWETLSKACYHLGNRHVKLQVGERWLRIKPDHVLEEMLKLLGLSVTKDEAVFVPESGAYSSHTKGRHTKGRHTKDNKEEHKHEDHGHSHFNEDDTVENSVHNNEHQHDH